MKFTFRLFCASNIIIFIAWIAKMHFIFGGDYLFRIGTFGILVSLVAQIFIIRKNPEIKSNNLNLLFIINIICLSIAFLGIMMKVSHLMNTQFEKDLVLDFIGIPAIVTSLFINFIQIDRLVGATKTAKIIFYRHIIMPWTLFLFSFLLYAVYSVILVRI
jgi:hypothetical protein